MTRRTAGSHSSQLPRTRVALVALIATCLSVLLPLSPQPANALNDGRGDLAEPAAPAVVDLAVSAAYAQDTFYASRDYVFHGSGDTLSFSVTVTNNGDTATTQDATVDVPRLWGSDYYYYPSISGLSCSQYGDLYADGHTCTVPAGLAPGASVTATFTQVLHGYDIYPPATFTVTTVVSSPEDSNDANDSATDSAEYVQNKAPVITNETVWIAYGSTRTVDVLANDTDPEGDALTLTHSMYSSYPVQSSSKVVDNKLEITVSPYDSLNSHITSEKHGYGVDDGYSNYMLGYESQGTVTVNFYTKATTTQDTATIGKGVTSVTVSPLTNDSGDALELTSIQGASTDPGTSITADDWSAEISGSDVVITPDLAKFASGGSFEITYTATDVGGTTATGVIKVTVAEQNAAPVAKDDLVVVAEDGQTGAFDVTSNDTDADDDVLVVTDHTVPSHAASFQRLPDTNTFDYEPAADFHGTDSFTYTVVDGKGGTDTATVKITVTSVNDAPVAAADEFEVAEDTPLTVTHKALLGNDNDIDSEGLVVTGVVSGPSHGTLDLVDGGFLYSPDADFHGTDSFTYEVSDGPALTTAPLGFSIVELDEGLTDTATVTITVTPVNDAPVAGDDTATVTVDGVVAVDVLDNDSDVEGDTLQVTAAATDGGGTATVSDDGTQVLYTAPADAGQVVITYTVDDGNGGTDTATLTVEVTPRANSNVETGKQIGAKPFVVDLTTFAPKGSTVSDVTITEVSPADAVDVTVNDDGTITIVRKNVAKVTQVTIRGTYTVTLPGGDTVKIDDVLSVPSVLGTSVETVGFTVDVTVVPVPEDGQVAFENDGKPVVVDLLDADARAAGQTVRLVTGPSHGTVEIVDGVLTYTPDEGHGGEDSIVYEVCTVDGDCEEATMVLSATLQAAPAADGDADPAPVGDDEELSAAGANAVPVGGGALLLLLFGGGLLAATRRRAQGVVA